MDQTYVPRMEVVPEVRELINDFYSSRYPSCLACLESMKPQLALDIHLHDHVDSLYEQIRHRRGTRPFIFFSFCFFHFFSSFFLSRSFLPPTTIKAASTRVRFCFISRRSGGKSMN